MSTGPHAFPPSATSFLNDIECLFIPSSASVTMASPWEKYNTCTLAKSLVCCSTSLIVYVCACLYLRQNQIGISLVKINFGVILSVCRVLHLPLSLSQETNGILIGCSDLCLMLTTLCDSSMRPFELFCLPGLQGALGEDVFCR